MKNWNPPGPYLYVIQQAPSRLTDQQGFQYVKVGRTTWPRVRFGAIQAGSPFELEIAAWFKDLGHVEKRVHSMLKKWHVRGEWYAMDYRSLNSLVRMLKEIAISRELDWWELLFTKWEEIDAELDIIEADDLLGIADVFWRFQGRPILSNGRRGHVNLSNFSTHISMPRHKLEALVNSQYGRKKETA